MVRESGRTLSLLAIGFKYRVDYFKGIRGPSPNMSANLNGKLSREKV